MTTHIETVESLMDAAKEIGDQLDEKTLSNSVARTKLAALKIRLDAFKTNMQASALGCDIADHATHEKDRARKNGGKLKVV